MKNLEITQAGVAPIIKDYLSQAEGLKFAYARFPEKESYFAQAQEKLLDYKHRAVLCQVLERQHKKTPLSPKQIENLQRLKQKNTVTITTGHQLNLATGPLYFIYKILHTVKLCDVLNKEERGVVFVPMYWMATEDHDFEEINHFNFYHKKYAWETDSNGAVGRLKTASLKEDLQPFLEELPNTANAERIKNIITEAYFNHSDLATATRALVQQILGEFGVLIIDADDVDLKTLMVPYFKEELLKMPTQPLVENTNAQLKKYKNQAYAREINLFYLSENLRERIVFHNGQYVLASTGKAFHQHQMIEELNAHPERFSPNVILRPLYQEVILPNVAYVGGAGEMAYWLQLKSVFEYYQVLFPILVLRNSVLLLPENVERKLLKFGLNEENLFLAKEVFIKKWLEKQSDLFSQMESLKANLNTYFDEVAKLAKQTHTSYGQMLEAQKAKQLKGFSKMKQRLYKSEKKRLQKQIERFNNIYDFAFPQSSWQERKINFILFYLENGESLFKEIYNAILPFEHKFIILKVNGGQL